MNKCNANQVPSTAPRGRARWFNESNQKDGEVMTITTSTLERQKMHKLQNCINGAKPAHSKRTSQGFRSDSHQASINDFGAGPAGGPPAISASSCFLCASTDARPGGGGKIGRRTYTKCC